MERKALKIGRGVLGVGMLFALAGGLGCASTGEEPGEPTRGRGDITAADLENLAVDDAMEAISLLRPQWMRGRSAGATIVIDGRRSTRDRLSSIRLRSIERIVFMSAADATIRFGTGFFDGAIAVTLK